jgi:hypothetical protein
LELVFEFEHMQGPWVAVQLGGQRKAHATSGSQTFKVRCGERFDVAGLHARVVGVPGAAWEAGKGEAEHECCKVAHGAIVNLEPPHAATDGLLAALEHHDRVFDMHDCSALERAAGRNVFSLGQGQESVQIEVL